MLMVSVFFTKVHLYLQLVPQINIRNKQTLSEQCYMLQSDLSLL